MRCFFCLGFLLVGGFVGIDIVAFQHRVDALFALRVIIPDIDIHVVFDLFFSIPFFIYLFLHPFMIFFVQCFA